MAVHRKDPQGPDLETFLSSRVEAILAEAERAAAGIRADAEARAREYLREARVRADEIAEQRIRQVSDLTDSLVQRVRAVAQQSDALIAALDDAGRRALSDPPPAQRPAPPAQPPAPPTQPPAPPAQAPGLTRPPSDEARLLATRMAVAGSGREEIARRLREEHGIADPNALLDEIGA